MRDGQVFYDSEPDLLPMKWKAELAVDSSTVV